MSSPWIAAFVCLCTAVVVLAVVVAGVLRRVAAVLEDTAAHGHGGRPTPAGPPVGDPLPALVAQQPDGSSVTLDQLDGPMVLAVLTSHCQPCLSVADGLAADPELMARMDGLVVLTDGGGRDRLRLDNPVVVLADPDGRAMRGLDLPGTPFVISVGADGLVRDAHVLAGVEDLVGVVEGISGTPVRLLLP